MTPKVLINFVVKIVPVISLFWLIYGVCEVWRLSLTLLPISGLKHMGFPYLQAAFAFCILAVGPGAQRIVQATKLDQRVNEESSPDLWIFAMSVSIVYFYAARDSIGILEQALRPPLPPALHELVYSLSGSPRDYAYPSLVAWIVESSASTIALVVLTACAGRACLKTVPAVSEVLI